MPLKSTVTFFQQGAHLLSFNSLKLYIPCHKWRALGTALLNQRSEYEFFTWSSEPAVLWKFGIQADHMQVVILILGNNAGFSNNTLYDWQWIETWRCLMIRTWIFMTCDISFLARQTMQFKILMWDMGSWLQK